MYRSIASALGLDSYNSTIVESVAERVDKCLGFVIVSTTAFLYLMKEKNIV